MSKFNENVKDLFENWNTIPNWMCFVRIALIPVFTVMFIKGAYIPAFITMIVAALTDVFDGKIARKFNMVSNLGKILDPIADKLSQIAIVIILIVKFWDGYLKYILFLFIVKELLMVIGGALLLSKGMRPVAAEAWGKAATVVFYTFMIIIIALGGEGCALYDVALFRPIILPEWLITTMVVISACLAFISLFGYLPGFLRQLKENKTEQNKADDTQE